MTNTTTDMAERVAGRLTPVLVNGQRFDVPGETISYEEVVHLAFDDAGDEPDYVVTYEGAGRPTPRGTLGPGDSVALVPRMTFSVRPGKTGPPAHTQTRIVVSGREYTISGRTVSYQQIVDIWNELHQAENKHILGTPGIDYVDGLGGADGILLPGESIDVEDGTSFSVDPEHVS